MFEYPIGQKTYRIGRYSIGGDPREVPTALAGTIFYFKQKKIFIDERNGIIDKIYAENQIKIMEQMSDKTGLTPLLDVILSFEESIHPILDFVFDNTDIPILVDAPHWEIKKPLINYLVETGLDNKIIYNSITSSSFDDEFELLSKTAIENYVLLPIESKFWTTEARMQVIDNLINKALSYNYKKNNFMIDTCVIDYTSLGIAMSAIIEVKKRYGYPAGTAGQNLADPWKNLVPKFGDIKNHVKIVGSIAPISVGADFIFYGPIQLSEIVFPIVAFIKNAQSKLLNDEH